MTALPDDELELVGELAVELGAPRDRVETISRVDLEVGDGQLSALRWGTGATSQVYLHGGAQNAHTWDRLLLLSDRGAVAIDLPGHGRSSWLEGGTYFPRELAPLVDRGIRAWAPEAHVVVGMSLGGLAAIHLAATRPGLVKRLVLVDVTPSSTPDRSRDIQEFVAVDLFDDFQSLLSHGRQHMPGVSERSLRRSLWHNSRQLPDGRWTWRHDRRDPPGQARMDRVFADLPRYWDDVAALRCPVLLVRGGRSPIVTDGDVEHLRALLPTARVVDVADAGHSVQSHAPRKLGQLIDRFVEETSP